MKGAIFSRIPLWCGALLVSLSWGCATGGNPQSNLLKEYRKTMDRQKASWAEQEEVSQKIPEMNAAGHEGLGDQYLRQGKLDLAFIQYQKSLQLDPGPPRIRFKLGRLFLEKGLNEEARKEFQAILEVDSRHALAFEGLGRVQLNLGEWEAAERSFQQALERDPGLWTAYNFMGILYDRQKKIEPALAQYRKAIALHPRSAALHNNLGVSLLLKGEDEKAARAFREALKIEPANKKVYNNLALALGNLGKYAASLDAFKKGGDEASAHYNLGCLYMERRKYQEAAASFEKALETKPSFYLQAYENLKKAQAAVQAPPGHP